MSNQDIRLVGSYLETNNSLRNQMYAVGHGAQQYFVAGIPPENQHYHVEQMVPSDTCGILIRTIASRTDTYNVRDILQADAIELWNQLVPYHKCCQVIPLILPIYKGFTFHSNMPIVIMIFDSPGIAMLAKLTLEKPVRGMQVEEYRGLFGDVR